MFFPIRSGSSDSGWVRQPDGTFSRRTSKWQTSSSSEASYGGVSLNQNDVDELHAAMAAQNEIQGGNSEDGDHGSNSTGELLKNFFRSCTAW